MTPRPLQSSLLCVTAATLLSCVAAGDAARVVSYVPSTGVPRVEAYARAAPALGRIIDYAELDGRLYLLDARGTVVVLAREGDAWVQEREFGRPGDGPGELRHPVSISAHAGTVLVAEPTRLQFFARDGALLATKPVPQLCSMLRPAVVMTAQGMFLYGDCYRVGLRTDTVVAVLAHAADTSNFEIVAREVRYTRDGRVGNVFNMAPAFSTGSGDHHLFGAGTANCMQHVPVADLRTVSSVCPAVAVHYRAEPPARLRAQLERVAAVNATWPDPLPPYMDRTAVGDLDVLVRAFTADSVVLQLAAPRGTDLAVGSFDELIRCRDGGCLWIRDMVQSARVAFLDAAAMQQLVSRAGAQ